MTNTLPTKFMILLCCMPACAVAQMIPPFEATYSITRGGKPTAEQHTKLEQHTDLQFQLSDITEGTHGMASLTGFKRSETTRFQLEDSGIRVNQHNMKQKVAFSKKKFSFKTDPTTQKVSGDYKGAFELTEDVQPISSHMLPIWLSTQVCKSQTNLTVPVLKSKNIKHYHFTVQQHNASTVIVTRIYPAESDRSTQMWFDLNKHCLPIKTRHQEGDDPLIETTIKAYTFKTNTTL